MKARRSIRNAQSRLSDPRLAVQEFRAGVWQPRMELVVFFCSSLYDLDTLADEMQRQFDGIRVVGCTTAGEIGPSGYVEHSLTGASFSTDGCTAVSNILESLHDVSLASGQAFARTLLRQLEERNSGADEGNTFAFLMIDGLSTREEAVTRTLQNALDEIPLIGGSAGDDLRFAQTHVFHGGRFYSDAAVLILISTSYPFKIFKTQHFISDEERLVVTSADAEHRIVREINGLPAAQEYARLIGVPVSELTPACFAASPVVVLIDGTNYVRSIQKVNPDGSLTFYCAIDEGLVFRVAHGENLLANLEQTFEAVHRELGDPQLVFACDCILRDVEMSHHGIKETVADIFRRNNAVGFSTYGEQFCGVHVNQTLTGIAIGSRSQAGISKLPMHIDDRLLAGASRCEAPNGIGPDHQPVVTAGLAAAMGPVGEEALQAEVIRLNKVIEALIERAERAMGAQGSDFGMFQTAILLETQVRNRTRELEEAERENERINRDLQRANRELEAFSYSVAHDLRAPLRSIEGFSRILEQDSVHLLDQMGRDSLRRVQESAHRMAQLIDDLLYLSRCSRLDLRREPVNLATLARQVVADLRQTQPDRQVEFRMADSLPAEGDARLLTVLLENLLGNAWKYSRHQAVAHIEFSFDPALSAFYVRDDGAGFDMAYAGKLFQVFQRLHSAAEFEGTGVGLAIVQRIVERHGGRIWAEGKVNEGATIYFTLPGSEIKAVQSVAS